MDFLENIIDWNGLNLHKLRTEAFIDSREIYTYLNRIVFSLVVNIAWLKCISNLFLCYWITVISIRCHGISNECWIWCWNFRWKCKSCCYSNRKYDLFFFSEECSKFFCTIYFFLSEPHHRGSFDSQKTSKLKTGPNQHNVISSTKLDPNLNISNSHSNAQRNFKSMIFLRYFINLLISISDTFKMALPTLIRKWKITKLLRVKNH